MTVFGFPIGTEDVVERYFHQFGSVVNHHLTPNNWLHLQYDNVEDARMVLEKNGITGIVEGHMLGVKKCDDIAVIRGDGAATGYPRLADRRHTPSFGASAGLRDRGRSRSRSRSRSRPRMAFVAGTPGHHSLLRSQQRPGFAGATQSLYKHRPRPANICTRIWRALFG